MMQAIKNKTMAIPTTAAIIIILSSDNFLIQLPATRGEKEREIRN